MEKEVTHADIINWIVKASLAVREHSQKQWPNVTANQDKLGYTVGKKYYRVYRENVTGKGPRYAYCFIDAEGNIYKPNGWNRVAEGIRSHITKKNPDEVTTSSFWLYR